MRKIKFLLSLFLLVYCYQTSLQAASLHAIIVADNAGDISHVTDPDLFHVQQEIKVIANESDLTLKKKLIEGKNFKRSHLINYLNHLSVEKNDVVFFYFSGHGSRTHAKTTCWPDIGFNCYAQEGLDLLWIANTIKAKKPSLALLIADCCNNFLDQGLPRRIPDSRFNFKFYHPIKSGYKELFRKRKGLIILCSSSPGQYSYGDAEGGICTNCFFMKLSQESYSRTPSWNKLLKGVSAHISSVQMPRYAIFQ